MGKVLTKDEILAADDRQVTLLDVPEWGGSVHLRLISGRERDAFEESIKDGDKINMKNLRARFVAMVLSDDKGNRLFENTDVVKLGEKSSLAIIRIFEAGRKLNGMGDDDIREMEKNLNSGEIATSGSDLPAN